MADFCVQCAMELFAGDPQDHQDLAGLCKSDEEAQVLCEGCGYIYVNMWGYCVCDCHKGHIHGEKHSWQRYGGYECSTKGDSRFSAFTARMPDGRTIEEHYQCDVKGYDVGGTNWRLGKGKPGLRDVDLWAEYLALWRTWAIRNPALIEKLREYPVLSDRFANTPINQARALATILNESDVRVFTAGPAAKK